MARVTKINVGGTNYDIAHEGELKNSGFEVVTSLPTTGLFEGREVFYKGKKYVYSTFYRGWIVAFDEKNQPLYNVINDRKSYEILGYDYSTYSNSINRSYLSKYLNYCNYTDDYLIEVSTNNETFTEVGRENKAYQIFNATNTEGFSVDNYKSVRLTIGYGKEPKNILSFYINHQYLKVNKIKIDQQLRSDLSWEVLGEVDFTAVNPRNYAVFFSVDMFSKLLGRYGLIHKIRFTIEFDVINSNAAIYNVFLIAEGSKYLAGINNYFKLSYKLLDCYSTIDYPITLNYDVNNIEPTQTGEVEKKANWVIRYLLQGVNWLKANKVALSVYNAKVAELVQADSDNNASIQSVSTDLTELSNGLAAVATSGDYNDLLNRPAFSGSYNDLTDTPTLAAVATSGDYNDLLNRPTKLPNPNPIIIKTTDGVSVRYDGSASGGVILEAGDNAEVTATQDGDDTMTVKFKAVVPQTLPNPSALNIMVLNSEGASLGSTIVYDGVAAKFFELIEGYGIELTNSNVGNGQAVTINLKQIAGTTLLGNANDTTGTPQAVTMAQLRTMLGSLTLNGTTVNLGDTAILPWYVDYNNVDYPARIRDHWLQIYRNGVWANLMYLGDILPTQVGQITSLDNLDWYNEQVSEYEVDSNTTTSILNGTTKPAAVLLNCSAEQLTLNLYPISGKQYGKGSLDSLISDLQGKGFSVFAENDLDAIIGSGSDYLVRIKISKVPTVKAIIECYVAR